MGLKEQFSKIKDNWLILIIFLVVLVMISGGLNVIRGGISSSGSYANSLGYADYATKSIQSPSSNYYGGVPSYGSSDFAPQVADRKVVKTTYLSSEVKRGQFSDAQSQLKSIITASGAYLLNEDVSRYGDEKHPYFTGSYQIKIDVSKYDAVISQLKALGVVSSFKENQADITGSYTNTQIELAAEKERLARYETMFKEATLVSDKITLNDRIFDQERTVKYLEESLTNMDQRVDYSTVYLTLNEKRSEYEYIAFVKFSELVSTLVGSFNALLQFIFAVAPWALLIGVIALVVRLFRPRG